MILVVMLLTRNQQSLWFHSRLLPISLLCLEYIKRHLKTPIPDQEQSE